MELLHILIVTGFNAAQVRKLPALEAPLTARLGVDSFLILVDDAELLFFSATVRDV